MDWFEMSLPLACSRVRCLDTHLFQSEYRRNNKKAGQKNLRCFPTCSDDGHDKQRVSLCDALADSAWSVRRRRTCSRAATSCAGLVRGGLAQSIFLAGVRGRVRWLRPAVDFRAVYTPPPDTGRDGLMMFTSSSFSLASTARPYHARPSRQIRPLWSNTPPPPVLPPTSLSTVAAP